MHPFFLWNCGARSGASQYHGHAQVALSEVQDLHVCILITNANNAVYNVPLRKLQRKEIEVAAKQMLECAAGALPWL